MPIKSMKDLYSIREREPRKGLSFHDPQEEYKEPPKYVVAQKGEIHCHVYTPQGKFYCTRPQGHEGEHEAHWHPGNKPCCPPWSDSTDDLNIPQPEPDVVDPMGESPSLGFPAKYEKTYSVCCGAVHPDVYFCTRPKGHSGEHEAHGTDGLAYQRWSTSEPEPESEIPF